MEPGKAGASNDPVDSGGASSRDPQQEISTGFSATAPPDPGEPPLSRSVFHDDRLDAQLDLDYGELDVLGSSSPQPPPLWSHLPRLKLSPSTLLQNSTTDTSFVPLESLYNSSPFFPFPTTWGASVPKSQRHDQFEDSSPRVMASQLLEIQACNPNFMIKSGSCSSGAHHEATPPAEKKRRSHENVRPHSNTETQLCRKEKAPLPGIGVRGGGLAGVSSSVMGTRELHSMEQLLIQCAAALEERDVSQAQQTIFVINNIAAVDGDPNQRLLAYFLRALLLRASQFAPQLWSEAQGVCVRRKNKVTTVLELTNYIDVMPWYRFGFIAANGAMIQAFEGKGKVHILDLNVSHCMQWPTLIETLAERSDGPPQVRLTVCVSKSPIPPLIEVPYDELLLRLAKFARSKNVPFEYEILVEDVENLDMSKIRLREDETLAVNCLLRLHYVSEEIHGEQGVASLSPRDQLLRFIRNLNPVIVTLTEEDANLTLPKLVPRLRAAFNYLWIPFDALHTLLPEESFQRQLYEDEVASKIENVVACEGRHRSERVETKDRWVQRMKRARFEMVAFSEDVVAENTLMLGEHSGCWGLRKAEEEEVLFLNWKGHTVSFATAWVPVDHLPL